MRWSAPERVASAVPLSPDIFCPAADVLYYLAESKKKGIFANTIILNT